MNRASMAKQIMEVPMKKSKGYMGGGKVMTGYKKGGKVKMAKGGKVSADMVSPRKAMAMGMKRG
jgi:hypothetical protein